MSREMNDWGEAKFNDSFQAHYPDGSIAANRPYELVRADGARIQGTTDADGIIRLQKGVSPEGLMLRFLDQGEETS
ncbi:hypothetical protein ASG87_00280 [Frateuria sp. Soil773]|nr:hypothetical protein ASG87_00280 [Frateuria sp. Soil773]